MTPEELTDLIKAIIDGHDMKTEEEFKENAVIEGIPMDSLIPVKFIENEIVFQKMAARLAGNRELGEITAKVIHSMIKHWEKCEDKIRWLK